MKGLFSLLILFVFTFQVNSTCPPLQKDVELRTDTFFLLKTYEKQIDFLSECVEHFISCEYFEEAIMWEWNKYIEAKNSGNTKDQRIFLEELEDLIDRLKGNISEEFRLEYKLQCLLSWSEFNYNLGFHSKALAILNNSIDLISPSIEEMSDDQIRKVINSYEDLGKYYYRKSDNTIAINFFHKALELSSYRSMENVKLSNKAKFLGFITYIYLKIGDREKALSYSLKYLDISRTLNSIHPKYSGYLRQAISNMAEYYVMENQIDSAMILVSELQLLEKKFHKPNDKSTLLLSKIYINQKEFDRSKEILNSFLAEYNDTDAFISKMKSNLGFEISDLLIKSKDFDTANSLLNSIGDYLFLKQEMLPSLVNARYNVNKRDSLNLLIQKLSLPKNNTESILEIKRKASKLLSVGFQSIGSKPDQLGFVALSKDFSEIIIENLTNQSISLNEHIFEAIESSKAILLFNEWKKNKLINISEKNDIFSQEEDLENELKIAEDLYLEETKEEGLKNIQLKFDSISAELAEIKEELRRRNNKYYKMKYDFNTPSLKNFQSLLKSKEIFINFFEGDYSLYALLISNKDSKTIRVDSIHTIRNLALRDSDIKVDRIDFNFFESNKKLSTLYDLLLLPFGEKLIEKIIISPSGSLNQIPFAALLTSKDGNPEDYLINKHTISYTPSATLFYQERISGNNHRVKDALLVAPKFGPVEKSKDLIAMRSGHGELIFNTKEVDAISPYFKNHSIVSNMATKQSFLSSLKNKDIVHLATHAKSNSDAPDKSYIAFYEEDSQLEEDDNLLYLDDLSKLYMPAKMVVLSACETGLGKIFKGEGAMSLANACFYAGAQSVLATLWSVQDRTTFEIIASFYDYLDKGYAKDEALQKAQLDFLENNPEEFHHPYYWAGYTIIGDNEPLEFVKPNSFLKSGAVIILSIALISTIYFLRRRNSKMIKAA